MTIAANKLGAPPGVSEAALAAPTPGVQAMNAVLSRKFTVLVWFAIGLVVWVHAYNSYPRYLLPDSLVQDRLNIFNYVQYLVANGLARFVMPLFFAVSGYLFFSRIQAKPDFGNKIIRRVRTVAIPYVLWNCIGIAWVLVARNLAWSQTFMPKYLHDQTWEDFARGFIFGPVSFQLWYLRDLFLLTLLSPVIYWMCRDRARAIVWLAALTVAWSFDNRGPSILGLEGVLFFSLGTFLALHRVPLQRLPHFGAWLTVAIAWLGLSLVRTWIAFDTVPMAHAWLLPLYKLCTLMGLWVVWYGYDFTVRDVARESWLWPWFGVSFYVFAAHQPLYNVLSDNILARIGHHEALHQVNPGGAFLVYLLLPIATIAVLSIIGMALKTKVPSAHSALTGGR